MGRTRRRADTTNLIVPFHYLCKRVSLPFVITFQYYSRMFDFWVYSLCFIVKIPLSLWRLQEFGVSGVVSTCIFLNVQLLLTSIWTCPDYSIRTWRGVLFLFLYVVTLLCDLVLALSSVRHLSGHLFSSG